VLPVVPALHPISRVQDGVQDGTTTVGGQWRPPIQGLKLSTVGFVKLQPTGVTVYRLDGMGPRTTTYYNDSSLR
jgi:hypothetical protein